MKTKYFLLAIFAFTLALGGAFASKLEESPESIYVKARRTIGAGQVCIQLNKTCDNSTPSSTLCQVQVPVTKPGIGSQTAVSIPMSGQFTTFNTSCSAALFDASGAGLQMANPTSGSIYELLQ